MAEVKKARQPSIRILVPMDTRVKFDELSKLVMKEGNIHKKIDFSSWLTNEINEQYSELVAGE